MHRRKRRRVWVVQTFGMAEATRALPNAASAVGSLTGAARAVWIRFDVKDNIVRTARIAANARYSVEGIEAESTANSPSDHMIGARRVAADAEPAHFCSVLIKRKPSAKDIYPANSRTDHRIVLRAEVKSAPRTCLEAGWGEAGSAISVTISDLWIDWIAML